MISDQKIIFLERNSTFEVSGSDAIDFLHRLTTADWKKVQPGQMVYGAMLSAIGRIQFLFEAAVQQNQAILFRVSPSHRAFALEMLEKYHFGEDLVFQRRDDLTVCHEFLDSTSKTESLGLSSWQLTWRDERSSVTASHEIGLDQFHEQLAFRGRPELSLEELGRLMLLELGLAEYFAEQKGCYPGQEVVERTLSRGQVPRKLTRQDNETVTSWIEAQLIPAQGVLYRSTNGWCLVLTPKHLCQ